MQEAFDDFVLWMLDQPLGSASMTGRDALLMVLFTGVFVVCSVFAVRESVKRMFQGLGPRGWLNAVVTGLVAVLLAWPVLRSLQWGFKSTLAAVSVKVLHMVVLVPASIIALLIALAVMASARSLRPDRERTRKGLFLAGNYAAALLAGSAFFLVYSSVQAPGAFAALLLVPAVIALVALAYFGVRAMLNGYWLDGIHQRVAAIYKVAFGTLFLASIWLIHEAFDSVKAHYGSNAEVEGMAWNDIQEWLPSSGDYIAPIILIAYGLLAGFITIPGANDLLTGDEAPSAQS